MAASSSVRLLGKGTAVRCAAPAVPESVYVQSASSRSARPHGLQERGGLVEASARRDCERCSSLRVRRVRIGAEFQQGRDRLGVLALVRATGHGQECLLVTDGNVQIEPFRDEELADGPVVAKGAEALRVRRGGIMIKQQAYQFDRAPPRCRGEKPPASRARVGSALEQQGGGRDGTSVDRMVQRRDGVKVLVR